MEIMREETFGPVLAVAPVDDADSALRLANDSAYGLSASVFTADEEQGEALARRIEAGGVFVNDVLLNALAFEAPFGGWKTSGLGARNGPEGIRKYCRQQLVGVTRVTPKSELYHYPLNERRARMLERTLVMLQRRPGRLIGGALALTARRPAVRIAALLTAADRRRRQRPR
jgi:delta 1-pyrroline-5-carboxylate dehydrogenase